MKTIKELEAEISKLRTQLYWLEREYELYRENQVREFEKLMKESAAKDPWYCTGQPYPYTNNEWNS